LPTLVVGGEEDSLIRADDARRSATKLPHGRFVGLPACGHVPSAECPAAFVAAVTPFLVETGGVVLPASKR
jgi:pimeloyl-ACP methyl ester carboxylesterase